MRLLRERRNAEPLTLMGTSNSISEFSHPVIKKTLPLVPSFLGLRPIRKRRQVLMK
jgi:hypothetical protein